MHQHTQNIKKGQWCIFFDIFLGSSAKKMQHRKLIDFEFLLHFQGHFSSSNSWSYVYLEGEVSNWSWSYPFSSMYKFAQLRYRLKETSNRVYVIHFIRRAPWYRNHHVKLISNQ